MIQFMEKGRLVTVWPSLKEDRPVVYLNTFEDEGERVYKELGTEPASDFTLVAISGLDWNHDMAPWDIPTIFEGDTACTGGADDYLGLLMGEIMPRAEKEVRGRVLWRGIAGYSLAGLFAVYSLYRTEVFSRAASMSGSLWFPGFWEYVVSHELKREPECIYFSLGDRECRTGNPYLRVVQERTEEIEAFYRERDGYRISEQSGRAREKYSQKDGGGYCLDLGGLPEELNKR